MAARPLTVANLDRYYEQRAIAKRALAVLETSPEQLDDADRELSPRLKRRHHTASSNELPQGSSSKKRKPGSAQDSVDEINQEFEAMVKTLDRRHFWELQCSGRYVEDVLIEAARKIGAGQHEIHSLIIYMSDPYTRNLFTADEWSEISNTNSSPLPELPQPIMEYLETFNQDSIENLHRAADNKLPIKGNYTHERHWAFRWIRIAVESWLGLYCQRPEPLKVKQLESFYRNDVFGIINSLLRDVQDLVVVHGEVASDDTAARRNDDRALPISGVLERKRMGPRCDGLVQIQGEPSLNIAVLEAAKIFDTTSSKFPFDTQKAIRTLHDMLRSRLGGLHVRTRRHELTLVGYIVSGPSLLTLFASCPGGHVVRVKAHQKSLKFADDISHFKFNLRILKHLLITKQMLQTTKEIIQETLSEWDDDDDDEAHEVEDDLGFSELPPTSDLT
ncbi:hypothetical protein B0O80DRAFT_501631 [Mortierella sp. GBAus27b]|nr:hypothetical protein B0O80DRAFT_501631 [Mortierella sp. GBAus27b]